MTVETIIHLNYLVAAACFILALKWLSSVPTARRGVVFGIAGMVLAVMGALLDPTIQAYRHIVGACIVAAGIGIPLAMIPMTAVPQRTALSHAFGALAAALVGTAEFIHPSGEALRFAAAAPQFFMVALVLEILLGSLTFTASLMAFGKLQDLLPSRPMVYRGQNFLNLSVLAAAVLVGVYFVVQAGALPTSDSALAPYAALPHAQYLYPAMLVLAMAFGVLLILPIGGADMPTVISLLNSYAGLSAAMMGFVLNNKMLIIAGALDGSSGLILSIIMCKAMNRSFGNVLFGAFGQVQTTAAAGEEKAHRSASAEEAAELLGTAASVIIVPGYGMAVAQAQHKVRDLFDNLTKRGVNVRFAIHPVAGRMPGHMNVLLADADIPYDKLLEMDEANAEFPTTDVALVIGANDVTNPAARHDKSSPIYGMPILDTDKARLVMVIKRSMNPGFAGVDNELYYEEKTLMLFGDAKAFVTELVKNL